jgi:hypothetical protein
VGVRLRDADRDCLRSDLPSAFAGCFARGVAGAFSATATAVSGSVSASDAVAAPGFFLPLPPRLPRRRLFLGAAGELGSSTDSGA